MFFNALDAFGAVMYAAASTPVAVTDADAVARGITTGVSGTSAYYGQELPKDTPQRGFYRARILVVTSTDNAVVGPRLHLMDSAQSIIHSADLVLEKIISPRLRMYSVDAPYNLDAQPVSFTVGLTQTGSDAIVCGAQAYVGSQPGMLLRADYPRPYRPEPLYGRHHFAIVGRDMPILKASLLAERDDPSMVSLSAWSAPANNAALPWRADGRQDALGIDTSSDFSLTTMTERGARVKRRYTRAISNRRVSAPAPSSPKILALGDSITNRNILALMKAKLEAIGKTPQFFGTMNNRDTGTDPIVNGEGRGGWRAADFIYQFTTYGAVTDFPAYLALGAENADAAGRWGRNPYARDPVGGDDPAKIRNGKIFGFRHFLNGVGIDDPDFVPIGLGTNDINTHAPASSLQFIVDAMHIMVPSIREACPNAQIAWWLPNIPRIASSDRKWREEYVPAIKAMLAFEQSFADDKFSILSTWAVMDTISGWSNGAENGLPRQAAWPRR